MDAKREATKTQPADWSVMRQVGPLAEELERYTTAQLLAEVNRRRMDK